MHVKRVYRSTVREALLAAREQLGPNALVLSTENVDLIRTAYEAYARGDVQSLLELVDPELEWTYLDPSLEDPDPEVCHGRHELRAGLDRQAQRGLKAELEEVVGNADRV